VRTSRGASSSNFVALHNKQPCGRAEDGEGFSARGVAGCACGAVSVSISTLGLVWGGRAHLMASDRGYENVSPLCGHGSSTRTRDISKSGWVWLARAIRISYDRILIVIRKQSPLTFWDAESHEGGSHYALVCSLTKLAVAVTHSDSHMLTSCTSLQICNWGARNFPDVKAFSPSGNFNVCCMLSSVSLVTAAHQ